MLDAAARGWRVVGTDLSHEACAAARRATGAPVVQADADRLPFRAGALDAVTLVNVLDHTTRPLAVACEAARVLRPGGLVAMRVPNGSVHARCAGLLGRLGPGVRWYGWDAYPILHVFAFGPRALRRLAERAGFERVRIANSTLASPAPGPARSRTAAVALRAVRALAAAGGALAAVVSGGRWRLGPSIELFARRREAGR
jgi:SAM-dependent methyltransferase